MAAGTAAEERAADRRAVEPGCKRAARAPDGTEAEERAADTTAAAGRRRDRCSEDRTSRHRSRCYGTRAGLQGPGTAVAGTATVADSRRWARAVVVQVGPLANDHQTLGIYGREKTL